MSLNADETTSELVFFTLINSEFVESFHLITDAAPQFHNLPTSASTAGCMPRSQSPLALHDERVAKDVELSIGVPVDIPETFTNLALQFIGKRDCLELSLNRFAVSFGVGTGNVTAQTMTRHDIKLETQTRSRSSVD